MVRAQRVLAEYLPPDSGKSEQHAFRPGRATYGQEPEECFYCWGSEGEHEDTPLELHGLLPDSEADA